MLRLAMPVVGLLIALAVPAVVSAAEPVDPSTLTPEPPPGAHCHAAGNQLICDTRTVTSERSTGSIGDLLRSSTP